MGLLGQAFKKLVESDGFNQFLDNQAAAAEQGKLRRLSGLLPYSVDMIAINRETKEKTFFKTHNPQRDNAIAQLTAMGTRCIPTMIACFDDTDPGVAQGACDVLVRIGPEAVDPLTALLSTSSKETPRVFAAGVLGKIGDPRAVPTLKRVAAETNSFGQQAAQEALDRIIERNTSGA